MARHHLTPGMTVDVTPSHRNVFGVCYDDDPSRQVRRGQILYWVAPHGGCWAVEPDGRPGVTYYYSACELKPFSILDELAGLT
jgi:hypothetical protein